MLVPSFLDSILRKHNKWEAAQQRIDEYFADKKRPHYHGDLPQGNNGLGLAMLGITSDRLIGVDGLDQKTYEKIKGDVPRAVEIRRRLR